VKQGFQISLGVVAGFFVGCCLVVVLLCGGCGIGCAALMPREDGTDPRKRSNVDESFPTLKEPGGRL
jgi:hypothetical protein